MSLSELISKNSRKKRNAALAVSAALVAGTIYYKRPVIVPVPTPPSSVSLSMCAQNPTAAGCSSTTTSVRQPSSMNAVSPITVTNTIDPVMEDTRGEIQNFQNKSRSLLAVLKNRDRVYPACEDSSIGRALANQSLNFQQSGQTYSELSNQLSGAKETYYGIVTALQKEPACNSLLAKYGEAPSSASNTAYVSASSPSGNCDSNPTLCGSSSGHSGVQ